MHDQPLTHQQQPEPELKATSPFIAGSNVQFAWDSVSLTTLLECPQRYKLRIIDGWASKAPGMAVALTFGILFHTGVEFYNRGRSEAMDHPAAQKYAIDAMLAKTENGRRLIDDLPTEDAVAEAKQRSEDEDDGMSHRNANVRTRYHLMRAVVWYSEQYKNDPLKLHIMPTGRPAVELSFRAPIGVQLSDGTELVLAGHIDRVVEFNDQLFVSDFKTTKSISRQWAQGFDLSHQMTGYVLGGSLALSSPVAGAIIDGVALQVGGVKFGRHFSYRTPSQLGEYMRLLRHVADQAEQFAAEDFYPLNTAACIFCEFKEVCRQPPEQRGRTLDYLFERKEAWNPLKSR